MVTPKVASNLIPQRLSSLWRTRQNDVLAISVIFLFFLVFFSWTIFTGRHVIEGDSLFYTYPLRTIAWRMIRAGELPLWTPGVFSGYPLLSMAQLGLGYPLTWGYLILPGYLAEKFIILIPFLLAPVFTYLYLRTVQRSVLASLLGALTFGYGGMASSLANNGLFTNSVMWLPLLLIVLDHSRRSRFTSSLVWATCIYSMSVLTGYPQGFITIGLLAGAYAVWLSIFMPGDAHRESSGLTFGQWRPLSVAFGAAILSFGVAAFQFLESTRVLPLSVRSSLTYEAFTQGSYDLKQLWGSIFTPLFNAIDTHACVPPLAIGLSCVALFAHIRRAHPERDTRVYFWSATAMLALAFMLGQHTPLYLILYYIPLLNLLRVPSRHTVEWTFAVGILSAYGWDALRPVLRRWREKSRRSKASSTYASLGLLAIGVIVGYQWWVLGQSLNKKASPFAPSIYQFWKVLFVVLLLAALWRAALITSQRWRHLVLTGVIITTCFVEPSLLIYRWWSSYTSPTSKLTSHSKITEFLKQFPAFENRVYTRTALSSEQEINPRFDPPNLSGMWGQHEVAGYEPLILQRYSRALGGAWLDGVLPRDGGPPDETLVSERSHVLDLLNTTFMISYGNLATALTEADKSTGKPSQYWQQVFENRGAIVWRNSRALPRAWLVGQAEATDSAAALRRIRGETDEPFDPRQTVLLEVSQNDLPNLPGGPLPENSSAKITSYKATQLTIDTDAPTNTILVVSEISFPGWEVTVDGKPDRILTADYLLRAVSLPPGQHKVRMSYPAPAARTGAIISIFTLGLLGTLAVLSWRSWLGGTRYAETGLPATHSNPRVVIWLKQRLHLKPTWFHDRRLDLLSVGFFVLFFLAFFARVFINNRYIITGDAFYYSYPLRSVAWDMIRTGQLPVWTPLFLSGYPLLAVAQLGLGYPITWFHLILSGQVAEQIFALAPFVITPVTTYAYLRENGRSYLASIFGALTFAYGGMMCGILANSGMLTNSLAWAPLILIFVDRARTRSFTHCLVWASLSYGLSVQVGHSQSYAYVALLMLTYGAFTTVTLPLVHRQSWMAWTTWRPLLVSIGAIAFGAGLAAFQLLEVAQAARLSIRSALPYQIFSEGSFSLHEALLSLGAPIYHYIDSGTYLTPLAFLMAVIAVIAISRKWVRDERIFFWIAIAAIAWILLLGSNTPLNKLIYRIPIMNGFRVPSRHTFEWTLAISILSAYGWDIVENYFRQKRPASSGRTTIIAVLLLAIAAVVSLFFWRALARIPEPNPSIYTGLPERAYWEWKLLLSTLVLAAAVFSFYIAVPKVRTACLLAVIGLACFVEANATTNCWWAGLLSLPPERFQVTSNSTRYLQRFPPEQNRVYTRVGLFSEEFTTEPRLEAPNLTMLANLQNVAGMEPLMLERYSHALGDVGPDSVTGRLGIPVKNDLFMSSSHVLDILNATHAVTFTGSLGIYEEVTKDHDGVGLSVGDLKVSLAPGESMDFRSRLPVADELALVSALSNSVSETDNAPIARVRIITTDGHTVENAIRSGVQTAEWAHERPDVRSAIKHRLASVFDERPGDDANSFPSYRYWGRVKFDSISNIDHIEITNVSQTATIAIWKLSLVNSRESQSFPLWIAPSAAWSTVFEDRGAEVLKNSRALPRAWLVGQAQAVDQDTALRAIRGEGSETFDPREKVLLEVKSEDLPKLPDARIDQTSEVHLLSYQPTHLSIETNALTSTVLVVSELFYPGWEATLDGQKVPIMTADYLLRAVAVPAGRHRIEMRYTAPAARNGALVAAGTLALLLGMLLYDRWPNNH